MPLSLMELVGDSDSNIESEYDEETESECDQPETEEGEIVMNTGSVDEVLHSVRVFEDDMKIRPSGNYEYEHTFSIAHGEDFDKMLSVAYVRSFIILKTAMDADREQLSNNSSLFRIDRSHYFASCGGVLPDTGVFVIKHSSGRDLLADGLLMWWQLTDKRVLASVIGVLSFGEDGKLPRDFKGNGVSYNMINEVGYKNITQSVKNAPFYKDAQLHLIENFGLLMQIQKCNLNYLQPRKVRDDVIAWQRHEREKPFVVAWLEECCPVDKIHISQVKGYDRCPVIRTLMPGRSRGTYVVKLSQFARTWTQELVAKYTETPGGDMQDPLHAFRNSKPFPDEIELSNKYIRCFAVFNEDVDVEYNLSYYIRLIKFAPSTVALAESIRSECHLLNLRP